MAVKITVVAADAIENVGAIQVQNILKDAGIEVATVNIHAISQSAYEKAIR